MIRIGFVRAHLSGAPPSMPRAAIYGLLLVAAPTALRILIDPVVSGLAFVTYFPFVLIASLFMSWGQASTVTLVSALAANYLFMEPRYTLFAEQSDTIGTAFFVTAAFMVVAVGQTLRRAVRELQDSRVREAHLNRELQHRVKNTLAVVQGLATQTFRNVAGAGASLDKLQGRIRALADANEILRHGQWEEGRLPELAVRALEPFNTRGAVALAGPECSLPEDSCVPLVLALHELATNAVKYGALSTEQGTVELTWSLSGGELQLDWQERGGPPVRSPVERGLGAKLLRPQPGLRDVRLVFDPAGVVCFICIPGARLLEESEGSVNLPPVTLYSPDSASAGT